MNTPRFVALLRLPSRLELFSFRVLGSGNGNTSRFICSDATWLSYPLHQRKSSDCISTSVLSHRPLLKSSHQYGIFNQTYRYNSLKPKEDPRTNPGADSTKPQTDNSPLKQQSESEVDDLEQFKKLSLYGKIKAMYRDYWYVLAPVHIASSIVFFGAFYYTASSGVDVVAILESLHFSETVVSKLRDSSAGYIAIAYALYKIFTPVRYTVTLGGTTWAIRFLKNRGLIKPRRPMKEAKENVQNIISAMKLPEKERQKFLEDKGLPRIGKAVGQASSAMSNISNKSEKEK